MTELQQIEELIKRRNELVKAEDQASKEWGKVAYQLQQLEYKIESLSCREFLPMSDTEQWDHWIAHYNHWDIAIWYNGRTIEILDSMSKPNSPDSIRGRVGEYPPAETIGSLIHRVYQDFNAKPLPLSEDERVELAELRGELETVSQQEEETRERDVSIARELREIEPRIRELEYEWVQGRPLREQWPVVMRRLTESGYRVYYYDGYGNRDEPNVIHWDGMDSSERECFENERRLAGKKVPTDETAIRIVVDEYRRLYTNGDLV